jgi:hypothetical protein
MVDEEYSGGFGGIQSVSPIRPKFSLAWQPDKRGELGESAPDRRAAGDFPPTLL